MGLLGDSLRGQGTPPPAGPAYEHLGIYDAPGVFLAQLIEDEASFTSLKNTFLTPERLSPKQRTDLGDRLLSRDSSPIKRALIGVATDPWVWLMFLTSPVGGKALASGASFFKLNKAYSGFLKKTSSWLSHFRSPAEEFSESMTTVMSVTEDLQALGIKGGALIDKQKTALLAAMDRAAGKRLKWNAQAPLSSSSYVKGTEEYERVRSLEAAMSLREHGFDVGGEFVVPEVRRTMWKRGPRSETWEEVVVPGNSQAAVWESYKGLHKSQMEEASLRWRELSNQDRAEWIHHHGGDSKAALDAFRKHNLGDLELRDELVRDRKSVTPHLVDAEHIDREFAQYGGAVEQYMEATTRAKKDLFVDLLGVRDEFDKTGQFVIDEDKLTRVASAFSREIQNGQGPLGYKHTGMSSLQGKEAVISLLGVGQYEHAMRLTGKERVAHLRNTLADLVSPANWNKRYWGSRNTYQVHTVDIAGKRQLPLMELDDVQRANLIEAPWATSNTLSNTVNPITEKELVVNLDDLEYLQSKWGLTKEGREHYKKVKYVTEQAWAKDNKAVAGLTLKHEESHQRYMNNTSQAVAWDSRMASDAMIAEDFEGISKLDPTRTKKSTYIGLGEKGKVYVDHDLNKGGETWARKHVSPGALMDRFYVRQMDPVRQDRIRNVLVPGALGNAGIEWVSTYNSHLRNKEAARWLGNSFLGKTIEKFGKPGREFMAKVREWGDPSTPVKFGGFSEGLAKWFYVSHLGLNASSMVLNLTQPLTLAATTGRLRDVLGAYKDSFLEMADYAKKRAAIPRVFLSDEEHVKLIRSSFSMADHLGIGPDFVKSLDGYLAGGGKSTFDKAASLMLKGFEKTEWFNRNTSAHLLKRAYEAAGRVADHTDPTFISDVKRFVLQTQFGASDLNTPFIFQKGVLANPLMRQFMSFPLRSFTAAVDVFPKAGDSTYLKGLFNTSLRAVGMSAIMYEVGKGLMGADLSRGLYVDSTLGMFNTDRMSGEAGGLIPVPPVIKVPFDFLKGVIEDDAGGMMRAVARVVPGGVAINRALGYTGEWGEVGGSGFPRNLQQSFVGWDQRTPDGKVPVYSGEGSLVGYQSPSDIVLKAAGVSLNSDLQGESDGYLIKNREALLEARHQYLRLLAANNIGGAISVQQQFQRKYGVPLTVNESQVKQYMARRVEPRTARILKGIDASVRPQYMQMMQGGAGVEQYDQVQEAVVNEIVRRNAEAVSNVGGAARTDQGAFQGFGGFR